MAFIEPLYQNPEILVTVLISAAVNIAFVLLAFVEPYKSVFQHAIKTWTHQEGKKLNALIFTKSGALLNKYGDIEQDGTFNYRDQDYAVVKKAFFNYKGLPTQLYKENVVEPFDPFSRQEVKELTTQEAEAVMMSNVDPLDLKNLLRNYGGYALFTAIGLIGVLGALAYLNYQVFDVVVQQGQQAVEIANQG